MKKKWLGIRMLVGLCAALGWWGLIYPELTMTPDTVVIRLSDDGGIMREQPLEWDFDSSLYRDLLDAGPQKITYRSRFITNFSSLWEAFYNGDK